MASRSRSPRMQEVERIVRRVAPTDLSILITGETGVGKGLLAKQIVSLSQRRDQPFIQVNSAAIPDTLFESELFGHKPGAFTDANAERQGHIERADGGTLFFDEIGELSLESQAKLLHTIEDREITSLGSNLPLRVDLRILAATSKDLAEEVSQGRFRRDLYFRLNEIQVHLPPLRRRREDILALADHFIRNQGAELGGRRIPDLTPERLRLMQDYAWPGNIRELENFIKSLMVLGNASLAFSRLKSAMNPGGRSADGRISLPEMVRRVEGRVEKKVIERTLQRTGWHRKNTAAILNISYRSLLAKIKQFELAR